MLETKKQYKVISPMEGANNSTWWMRVGNAQTNKDGSINVYLDAMPKTMKFQIRELDERELREREERREKYNSRQPGGGASASLAASAAAAYGARSGGSSGGGATGGGAAGAQEDIPF